MSKESPVPKRYFLQRYRKTCPERPPTGWNSRRASQSPPGHISPLIGSDIPPPEEVLVVLSWNLKQFKSVQHCWWHSQNKIQSVQTGTNSSNSYCLRLFPPKIAQGSGFIGDSLAFSNFSNKTALGTIDTITWVQGARATQKTLQLNHCNVKRPIKWLPRQSIWIRVHLKTQTRKCSKEPIQSEMSSNQWDS